MASVALVIHCFGLDNCVVQAVNSKVLRVDSNGCVLMDDGGSVDGRFQQ